VRHLGVAVVLAVTLAACGTGGTGTGVSAITPRDGRSGLSLTGTIGGRQVAVSDGAPRLILDDCDINTGFDVDLCFFSRDIDGTTFGIVIENPDLLVAGERLPVVASTCHVRACDGVTDGLVVDVQLGVGKDRVRADGGHVDVTFVDTADRYAGTLNVTLPDGRIGGTFDVVPRPDEE
jgi:hypothetical protein